MAERADRIQQAAPKKPDAAAPAAEPAAAPPPVRMSWGWRWLLFFWITSYAFLLLYEVLRTAVQYIGYQLS